MYSRVLGVLGLYGGPVRWPWTLPGGHIEEVQEGHMDVQEALGGPYGRPGGSIMAVPGIMSGHGRYLASWRVMGGTRQRTLAPSTSWPDAVRTPLVSGAGVRPWYLRPGIGPWYVRPGITVRVLGSVVTFRVWTDRSSRRIGSGIGSYSGSETGPVLYQLYRFRRL